MFYVHSLRNLLRGCSSSFKRNNQAQSRRRTRFLRQLRSLTFETFEPRFALTVESNLDLVSNVNPAEYSSPVTFSVTVTSGDSSVTTVPTGVVNFYYANGTVLVDTETLDGSGHASFVTNATTMLAGSDVVEATYEGDDNFDMTVNSVAEVIDAIDTTTTVATTASPTTYGQANTATATVTSAALYGIKPAGDVTFYADGAAIGDSMVNGSGVATFDLSGLSTGTHAITAQFSATDSREFNDSSSGSVPQEVDAAPVAVTLTSDTNPSNDGDTVTFTATVSATGGYGNGMTPTGDVEFYDGVTDLGSETLSSGVATFSIATLTVGTHTIQATYLGDANFAGGMFCQVNQVVNPLPTVSVQAITEDPVSALDYGAFEGNVINFTVSVTLPAGVPALSRAVTVTWATQDGTGDNGAIGGTNFYSDTAGVTFPIGASGTQLTSSPIVIQTIQDTTPWTANKNFSVAISNVTNATIAAGSASANIDDNVLNLEIVNPRDPVSVPAAGQPRNGGAISVVADGWDLFTANGLRAQLSATLDAANTTATQNPTEYWITAVQVQGQIATLLDGATTNWTLIYVQSDSTLVAQKQVVFTFAVSAIGTYGTSANASVNLKNTSGTILIQP